jgi:HisJ family histidinol phosphate phosphatase
MCVTNNKIKTLTEKEIEILKQHKLNELCECIEEMKEETNIQGVTIWSVNDAHNFMLSIENEKLIEIGEKPLETVYGGYFGKDMRPRQLQKSFQEFNFHTHTQRCGHASFESDRDYVLKARENEIISLGFSEHIPYPKMDFQNDKERMHFDDVDEYLESIERLQKENQDMEILSGFEAEYDPKKEQFIGTLASRVDYMILGQHYVPEKNAKANPNYPLEYAKIVVEAIESGIFDIIAHPDIFMQYEDTMTSEEERQQFNVKLNIKINENKEILKEKEELKNKLKLAKEINEKLEFEKNGLNIQLKEKIELINNLKKK